MALRMLSNYPAYGNYYHFIGCSKHRKFLFESEILRSRVLEVIKEIVERTEDMELVVCTVAYDHVHILVRTGLIPSRAEQLLFGTSSRMLRKEFPLLVEQSKKGLWGGTSCKAIKDKNHFPICTSYITRHQPNNEKI